MRHASVIFQLKELTLRAPRYLLYSSQYVEPEAHQMSLPTVDQVS